MSCDKSYDVNIFLFHTHSHVLTPLRPVQGSILDPTQTQPIGVGWRNSKSTAGINRSSLFQVKVSVSRFGRSSKTKKKSLKSAKKSLVGKFAKIWKKSSKYAFYRCNMHLFHWNLHFFAKNCWNLAESG